MKVVSVNIARPAEIDFRGQKVKTGIFKEPAAGNVRLGTRGFDGDVQVDRRFHGGPHQAAYLYSAAHYPYWHERLNRQGFTPGFFGENLTVDGIDESTIHIGDIFRAGTALIQATEPRQPCFKMAAKIGLQSFPKLMLESGKLGCYFSVIREGEAGAGSPFELDTPDPNRVRLSDIIRILFAGVEDGDENVLERLAGVASLTPTLREMVKKRFGLE